ncbi:hypothetical protein [Paracoccus contaminans]|uniref:Uncharacterized protein n=1 Tax=Paracoccus contaminans TaxID=1945662 RepID=A0A1W6CV67_9RHOB|nr:hypothetical protein [Paracoccus contaminans]ARJ68689.1 hypothetical protein B0A89_02575 [Paracoccus contaminans]
MSGGSDDRRRPVAWAIVFALMLIMLVLLAGLLIWALVAAVDWEAVLRFIAPTAFETRSIEEILEGGRR